MTKFLSSDGLRYFYNQIKSKFAAASHNHSAGDITSGTLPIERGGTGLTATPSILTNLGSTTAANVLQASPRPGVTGTLPIANGGTGQTTVAAAVKALLGTSALGSSTKPIYYDGAALKACADSIGGGGIIAQLLAENGYIKFANGLILQWGVGTKDLDEANTETWTFPISVNKVLQIGSLSYSSGRDGGSFQTAGVKSYTTKNCVLTGSDNGNGRPVPIVIAI